MFESRLFASLHQSSSLSDEYLEAVAFAVSRLCSAMEHSYNRSESRESLTVPLRVVRGDHLNLHFNSSGTEAALGTGFTLILALLQSVQTIDSNLAAGILHALRTQISHLEALQLCDSTVLLGRSAWRSGVDALRSLLVSTCEETRGQG